MSVTHRVLVDEELDRRLHRDGFVTFPLFSQEQVAGLRAQYGELHGWDGAGFESDLISEDGAYRQAASDAIGSALDREVTASFVGYKPFLRSFLCKFPGGDSSLYIHRDWMYVDERGGARTYAAWIALEDIAGHNGQLRVLRGSHEIDRELRGTDLIAPWIRHGETIEPRLLSVPVRAGDVVVFDNALVHSSFPNNTDQPRLAAAIGMRPVDEPLVHFRRSDPLEAQRFDVTEDFFLTETPQHLMAQAPDLPVAEAVAAPNRDLNPRELAAALDQGRQAKLDRLRHSATATYGRVSTAAAQGATWVRKTATQGGTQAQATWGRRRTSADERRSRWNERTSKAAMIVLGANEALINRFGPDHPAIWDPSQFPWAARVEAAWPEVRAEVDALLTGPTDIPHIEDVTGGIPQGNVGPWRTLVLMHQGRWIPWNCERCPRTTELVKEIPGLTVAGFSVLEPGTHITTHRGPNKGALRYQLGVIVPGQEGDCRIRVGDEMIHWREREGVMFDFTVEHEAWNDTAQIRVLLMLELITPLPWYLDIPNRLAQRAMGWFPTTRDLTERLKALEPSLVKP